MQRKLTYRSIKTVDSSIDINHRFEQSLINFAHSCQTKIVIESMMNDSMTVDWKCFECKTPIRVNIEQLIKKQRFNNSKLFCKKHKPESQSIFRNHLFIRYEDSFYKTIKNSILSTITTNE